MNDKQEFDRDTPFVLSSTDKDNGFSIMTDDRHNIILLEWNKPVAWFSAIVTKEVIREFVELIKRYAKHKRVPFFIRSSTPSHQASIWADLFILKINSTIIGSSR